MRFYLINRYFWPDESATAMLLTDLAEDMAARGHEVHVLSSRQLYLRPRARLPAFEQRKGVSIHRLGSTSFGRRSFMGRLFDIQTFGWALTALGKKLYPPDAWFVMTDPPLILERIIKLRKRLGGRIVHHVDDVYPDLAVALGSLPGNGPFGRWLDGRAIRALLKCDRVLALGGCMAGILIAKGVPLNRMLIVPPWSDGKLIEPIPHRDNPFRRELGLAETDFAVMYSGNMGKAHNFETILDSAKKVDADGSIRHIFIGGGAKKAQIRAFVEGHGLKNIQILPYQPRERLGEVLAAGDVHLISLESTVQGLIVPSKLAGVLAAGRPAILVGDGRNSVASALANGQCDYVVPDGETNKLATIIRGLQRNQSTRRSMGQSARRMFESEYERSVVVPRVISCLEGQNN